MEAIFDAVLLITSKVQSRQPELSLSLSLSLQAGVEADAGHAVLFQWREHVCRRETLQDGARAVPPAAIVHVVDVIVRWSGGDWW